MLIITFSVVGYMMVRVVQQSNKIIEVVYTIVYTTVIGSYAKPIPLSLLHLSAVLVLRLEWRYP